MRFCRLFCALSFSAVLLVAAGCHSCKRCCPSISNCAPAVVAPVPVPAPAARFYQPPVVPAPCNGCENRNGVQPPVQQFYQPPAVPGPLRAVPPRSSGSTGTWKPLTGEGVVPAQVPNARLMPPPPETPAVTESATPPPTRAIEERSGEFPADIPSFSQVYDRVSAGLQPFPDGFTWLKSHGYRTVLHLKAAGEDDSAVKTDVESKGLKYVALEVTPQKLNREFVEQFGKILRDGEAQPVFVYDRKGPLAGAMWYLQFRLADNLPEAEARKKAVRLGLSEDTTGDNADLWLAINQILRGA